MAPIKCSYHGCTNTSMDHSVFRFPIKEQHRLRTWLENAGNMTLAALTDEELHNRFICDAHFDKNCFSSHGLRTRLHKDAIPQQYSAIPSTQPISSDSPELKVKTPTKVYRKRSYCEKENQSPKAREKEFDFPTPTKLKRRRLSFEPLAEQVQNLKNTVSISVKKLKSKNIQLSKLKKKLHRKHSNIADSFSFRSNASKILTTMQLKKKITKWSEDEKNFCLTLYYKSSAVYKFLRKTGVVLASPASIQRWLAKASCLPGLSNESFENIKKKFADSSDKEKACIICFDEMSLMACLEYSPKYDIIEGFEDFGKGIRCDQLAKYVLVFIARGLYHNWKVPLCYYLSRSNVKADNLQHLIKSVILKSFESGLLPKAVTCDQGTGNVSALKKMGVTIENPYFICENRKIFSIFDVPHLIKNLRNNLLKNNYIYEGHEISFEDIIKTYNIDKVNKSRSLKKITPTHLNPNSFQKMKVSLATQIFSHSVAAVIRTVVHTGELKSSTALNTADFIEKVNDLFDTLNSRGRINKNPNKCALTQKNNIVRQKMSEGLKMAKKLKKIVVTKTGTKIETTPPCFLGLQQTIKAILLLFDSEHANGIKFILTNRLNQDVLENLFGLFRMKSGCNRNPTARVLRAVFRSNLLNSFVQLDSTNCESDKDVFVETTEPTFEASTSYDLHQQSRQDSEEEMDVTESPSSSMQGLQQIQDTEHTTLEQCSVAYFAGWLGKKVLEKTKCDVCKLNLFQENFLDDKMQLLILNKTYSNIETPTLKAPSSAFHSIIDASLNTFETHFGVLKYKLKVKNKLIKCIKKSLHFENLDLSTICNDEEHTDFILNKLVETKIHAFCKSEKKKLSDQAIKKIRVLSNV